MVAFDIETLDKEPFPNAVTAAAVYSGARLSRYFVFKTSVGDDPDADLQIDEESKREFIEILDKAPCLCSYNGIQFDMRFMRVAWNVPAEKLEAWILKTFDAFEACRLGLGRYFPLSKLLDLNQIESKSGSGAEAIRLAREHRWDELGEYCLQDTKVTYLLSLQDVILYPIQNNKRKLVVINRLSSGLFSLY